MTLILVITYIIGFLIAYRKSHKNFVSVEIISISSFGLIFLLPFINPYTKQIWVNDQGFKFLIWICLVVTIITLLYCKGIVFFRGKYKIRKKLIIPTFLVISVFIVYGWLVILVNNNFNLIEVLFANRVAEYLENGKDISDFALKIISFVNIVYIALIMVIFRNKMKFLAIVGYINILFYIIITTHTRFILLVYLLIPLLYYNFFIKKISTFLCIVGIILGGLFLSFTNFVRTGISDQFSLNNPVELILTQLEIKSVNDFYFVYNSIQKGNSDFDYGIQYFYYLPITIIPRSIWNDKPIVSYFWRLTKDITGDWPGPYNYVLTSTIYGEGYHQAGIYGIFIVFGLYIIFAKSYLGLIRHFEGLQPFAWFFLIHIAMDLRGAFSSVIVSYTVGLIMILLLKRILYYKES